MVRTVGDRLGPPTILVNNAALTRFRGPWSQIDEAAWDEMMAVNVKAAFLCFRAVHPHMEAAGWGRVINIGAVILLAGARFHLHYVTSKGAIVGFTRALAREVGAQGITVNCVSPGAIRVEMAYETWPDQMEALDKRMAKVQAIPRRGVPEDISGAVAFLASDEASFITGQLLEIDGGWMMH
jgi:3-oxoacyl-[acyl-carrier protein] reductase